MELSNILAQVRLTASKTKLDIQYSKLGIPVASGVAERLKTQDLRKPGNIRKVTNSSGLIAQCPFSLQKIRLWQQQLKDTQKQIPNFSFPVQFYWISSFCSKCFVRNFRLIQICRNQWWCSLFLFSTGSTLFGQILSKKSKSQLQLKFGTCTNSNIQNSMVMFNFSFR